MKTNKQALLLTALSLGLGGCLGAPAAPPPQGGDTTALRGTVSFEGTRQAQATMGEVANQATVSLIDASTGNTVASSITDAAGAFVFVFDRFTPAGGGVYVLEAVKGLSVGGNPNRAATSAVRIRTFLFWNAGWQSFTNSTVNTGLMVGNSTTALATLVSLKQQAGIGLTLTSLIGKINEGANTFDEASTGLSNANDFLKVLPLVNNAITLDQDPLGAIAYNQANGAYSLAIGVPWIGSITPAFPVPGGSLTLKGSNLDRLDGRNVFWFGSVAASTWSVSTDRTTATVAVPANAYSAPFTLKQPNGVSQLLHSFLKIKGTVGTLAGSGVAGYVTGPGPLAQFKVPYILAVSPNGTLYMGEDYPETRISKITPAGVVSALAGNGVAGHADGVGTATQFVQPCGIGVDQYGNVYAAEIGGHRIRKITPAGVVTTVAGSGVAGNADGQGTSAQFNAPNSVAINQTGTIYVADYGGNRIRAISPSGMVSTLAGSGAANYADGTGAAAAFNKPVDLALDPSGNLYVTDYMNQRIRKITPGGVVTTLAGSGVAAYTDATGAAAQFNNPGGIAVDANGIVYVTDVGNNRIRRITPAGVVTTLACSGVSGYADGSLATAQVSSPIGIDVDSAGNLYVADRGNLRIRVITP